MSIPLAMLFINKMPVLKQQEHDSLVLALVESRYKELKVEQPKKSPLEARAEAMSIAAKFGIKVEEQ